MEHCSMLLRCHLLRVICRHIRSFFSPISSNWKSKEKQIQSHFFSIASMDDMPCMHEEYTYQRNTHAQHSIRHFHFVRSIFFFIWKLNVIHYIGAQKLKFECGIRFLVCVQCYQAQSIELKQYLVLRNCSN